ncbi:hypothetical protein [Tateyamaria sp.]|uniref:hypothetical protein n=1 Tax=Tateyamaria sp. TaxID=1929288 RepID=UPI00329D0FC8
MQPNIVSLNGHLSKLQHSLVKQLFEMGAGHAGVLQENVACLDEETVKMRLNELQCRNCHRSAVVGF